MKIFAQVHIMFIYFKNDMRKRAMKNSFYLNKLIIYFAKSHQIKIAYFISDIFIIFLLKENKKELVMPN